MIILEKLTKRKVKTMREFVPGHAKLIPEQAECKFCGELFEVYQWPQKLFDESMATFEMLRREDTVVIIAVLTAEELRKLGKASGDIMDESKVVITYQTQPCQDWFYDYPGGRHDNPDETELEAAKRELREEAGLVFRNWKLVEVHQPLTKIDWLVYTFVATDLIDQVPQELDAGEKIEVLEVTWDELREYAKKSNSKYLLPDFMQKLKSLDELVALPTLHNYSEPQ